MSMWRVNAKVKKLDTGSRRIVVVSDIHGNLPYLKALLKKVEFSQNDELIIDGDFLEKGEHSLETLRYLMHLSGQGNVHAVCGNCDSWSDAVDARYSIGRYTSLTTCSPAGAALSGICSVSRASP